LHGESLGKNRGEIPSKNQAQHVFIPLNTKNINMYKNIYGTAMIGSLSPFSLGQLLRFE
jgi:hypothetical protein